MANPVHFEFTKDFQVGVLNLFFHDYSFARSIVDIISPNTFEDEVLGWFYEKLRDYYLDYDMLMTRTVLKQEIAKILKSGRFGKKHHKEIVSIGRRIYRTSIKDGSYIKKEVLTWVKEQTHKEAILEAVDLMKEKKFDEITDVFAKAAAKGHDYSDIGTRYFVDYPDRIVRRNREWDAIPTGIIELDELLRGRGVKKGHLALFLAPSKRGKTMALIHVAKSAIVLRKKTIYYILDTMDEDDIADRFDSSFTNLPFDQLDSNLQRLYEKIGKLSTRYGDSLIIKSYPTKGASVQTLRSHIKQCKAIGFDPELIVIDYGQLLKATGISAKTPRHEVVTSIYEGLSGLAGEFKVVLWSAVQSNRGAFQKDVVEMEDAGESIGPMQAADLVVALSQTAKERKARQMRLYVAANRHGLMEREILIRNKFETSTFVKKEGV